MAAKENPMILPPRSIGEPEIGDLSALNSTTMRSDRGFANLWPRASKLHRRDRTAWLSKPSALMLVIAASLRKILRQFSCGCAVVDVDQHTIVHCPPEAGDSLRSHRSLGLKCLTTPHPQNSKHRRAGAKYRDHTTTRNWTLRFLESSYKPATSSSRSPNISPKSAIV